MCHFLLRIVINMWFWFALCHVFLRYLYGIYGMYHGSFWLLFLQAKRKSSHFWEMTYWWMPLKATMLASLPMVRRVSNGVVAGGQGGCSIVRFDWESISMMPLVSVKHSGSWTKWLECYLVQLTRILSYCERPYQHIVENNLSGNSTSAAITVK